MTQSATKRLMTEDRVDAKVVASSAPAIVAAAAAAVSAAQAAAAAAASASDAAEADAAAYAVPDAATAAIVSNPATATATVLKSTFVPQVGAQSAENTTWTVAEVTPVTAGFAPFKIQGNSFANTGVGAGTHNHGVWSGFNVGRHSGGTVVSAAPASFMGLEDNYYDDGGDALYGPESYWEVHPAGAAASPLFRPLYMRASISADTTTTNRATVLVNVGTTTGGQFSVRTGATNLFTVVTAGITAKVPVSITAGPLSLQPTTGQAIIRANAGAGSQSRFQMQIGGADAWSYQANSVTSLILYDKDYRAHITHTYGATAAAATTSYAAGLASTVSVTTPTLLGSLGANKDLYVIPGAPAGQVIFQDGTQSFITLQIDTTGNLFPRDGKALSAAGATGFRLGNATTDKLGFWGKTPVVQQARPTDAASIITLLTTLGLCA